MPLRGHKVRSTANRQAGEWTEGKRQAELAERSVALFLSLSLPLFHLVANCCLGFISIKGNGGNARKYT